MIVEELLRGAHSIFAALHIQVAFSMRYPLAAGSAGTCSCPLLGCRQPQRQR